MYNEGWEMMTGYNFMTKDRGATRKTMMMSGKASRKPNCINQGPYLSTADHEETVHRSRDL